MSVHLKHSDAIKSLLIGSSPRNPACVLGRVLTDFFSQGSTELTVYAGEEIYISFEINDWAFVTCFTETSRKGYIPLDYCYLITDFYSEPATVHSRTKTKLREQVSRTVSYSNELISGKWHLTNDSNKYASTTDRAEYPESNLVNNLSASSADEYEVDNGKTLRWNSLHSGGCVQLSSAIKQMRSLEKELHSVREFRRSSLETVVEDNECDESFTKLIDTDSSETDDVAGIQQLIVKFQAKIENEAKRSRAAKYFHKSDSERSPSNSYSEDDVFTDELDGMVVPLSPVSSPALEINGEAVVQTLPVITETVGIENSGKSAAAKTTVPAARNPLQTRLKTTTKTIDMEAVPVSSISPTNQTEKKLTEAIMPDSTESYTGTNHLASDSDASIAPDDTARIATQLTAAVSPATEKCDNVTDGEYSECCEMAVDVEFTPKRLLKNGNMNCRGDDDRPSMHTRQGAIRSLATQPITTNTSQSPTKQPNYMGLNHIPSHSSEERLETNSAHDFITAENDNPQNDDDKKAPVHSIVSYSTLSTTIPPEAPEPHHQNYRQPEGPTKSVNIMQLTGCLCCMHHHSSILRANTLNHGTHLCEVKYCSLPVLDQLTRRRENGLKAKNLSHALAGALTQKEEVHMPIKTKDMCDSTTQTSITLANLKVEELSCENEVKLPKKMSAGSGFSRNNGMRQSKFYPEHEYLLQPISPAQLTNHNINTTPFFCEAVLPTAKETCTPNSTVSSHSLNRIRESLGELVDETDDSINSCELSELSISSTPCKDETEKCHSSASGESIHSLDLTQHGTLTEAH